MTWQWVAIIAMVFVTVWLIIAVGAFMNKQHTEQLRLEVDKYISDNQTKVSLSTRDLFGRPTIEHTGQDAPKRVEEPTRG